MKKYLLITEISPIEIMPENIPNLDVEKLMESMSKMKFTITDSFKTQETIPSYLQQEISEDTFKILENICNVEFDFYGEKVYICNKIRMRIKNV